MKSSSLLHGKRYGHNFLGLCCSSSPESALRSHRPTVAAPSRWQLRHVQEVPWKHAGMQARRPPGTAKELAICDIHNDTFDVTQCIAEHLLKGKPVLQLAANRCQATRRCVESVLELAANATMSSAMPQKSSCPVVWPAPKRRFLEYKENKRYIFSYQGLLAIEKSWKVDVLDLAAYRLWRTLRRGPSGGWAATADDMLASKSWLWHCSEKMVCEHSGVPAGQCARNCCCVWSCWLLLAGWLYSYKPYLLGDNSNILGNYIWTNHWFSGDIRSFSGE